MLDTAEKPICLVERQHFTARQQVQFTKSSQGSEHTGFLQEWMLRAVDKLECLHDEFDLANAAASKLHVALQLVGSNHVALDASLDVGDLIEQIGRGAFRINKRLMLPQEFVSQLATAGDSARLNQSQALPGFAETGVIIFHALERPGEWPGRTFRTKAQINAKQGAFWMTCGKCLEDFLSQPVKEFVVGNLWRELAFLAVEKEKIDIGTVIQLGASEFTQCQNGELGIRGAVTPSEVRIPMFANAANANIRDLRELRSRFLKWSHVGKFAQRDARHLTAFPDTKACEILRRD